MKETDEDLAEYEKRRNNININQNQNPLINIEMSDMNQEMNENPEEEEQHQLILNPVDKENKRTSTKLDKEIKNIKIKEIHNSYLYNIKGYLFFFSLMISSSINFSYLYLPYIFFGTIVLLFLIRNNNDCSKTMKILLEIVTLVYSILLLLFKIVCLILIKKDYSFIREYQGFFLNLGICYLRDEESKFLFFMTCAGEGIVIIFSLYSIFISRVCNKFRPIYDTSLMENTFWTTRNLIMLNFVFILSFATFNISFSTLFYMAIMQFIFFLDSLTSNRKKFRCLFKYICILLMTLILTQVIAINGLNIPEFQKRFLHEKEIKEEGSKEVDKVYSLWTQIGINYAYHDKLLYLLKEWIGYFSAVCSLLTLNFAIKTIQVNEFSERHKEIAQNIRKAKTLLKESEEEKKRVSVDNKIKNAKIEKIRNIFSKIYEYIQKIIKAIYYFILSPTFIIQFSRVMSIAWMYFYRNFYSLGIFITIFFSFLFISTKSNKYLTIFLLAPMVFISLGCFHYSNITGYYEKFDNEIERIKHFHFGLGKYQYSFLEYVAGNIFYIFIMFLTYSFFNSPKDEEKIKKPIKNSDFIMEDNKNQPLIGNEILGNSNQVNQNIINVQIVIGDDKKNKKIERTEDLTFINIILKAIFSNIDKITLIVMYFVAVKSINIIHLILVIIFLIQILFPNKIQNLFEIILCLLQFLFLFEILVELLKVYYIEEFNDNKNFISFILIYSEGLSDNNIEVFIYGVVYCFFFQYQIYNFPFLKRIIENKNITLANYVQEKFRNYERIQHILYLIGNIILELYIWILIGLFIFVSCFFEINFIFAFKLAWFLLLSYNFLKTVQNPEKGADYSSCCQVLFLGFCCINTLSVYLYQFISDDYINLYNDIKESTNFFIINLPNIGLTMYSRDNLYYNLFPHFGIIFISVLFIWEIRNQYKKISKDNRNKKIQKDKLENEIELKEIEKNKQEEDNNNIIITNEDKNKIINENDKQSNLSNLSIEEEISQSDKYDENKEILKQLAIRYFLVNIMRIITKFYWLLLFLAIGIIFSFYDLSFSMIFYIIIFTIIFILMFFRIITRLTKYISRPSYFISKVIRYSLVEVPRHIQINKYYRSVAFRFLLSYSFIFFLLLYLYGVFELFQNGCNNEFFKGCEERHEPIIKNNSETEFDIKAYSYLFGIYVNIRKEGLMNVAWIHILLSALIGFDVYAQKLENKFTEDSKEIKAHMQKISNENSELYHYIKMHDNNILIKIGITLAEIDIKVLEEDLRKTIVKLNKELDDIRNNSRLDSMALKSVHEQEEIHEINEVNTDENAQGNEFLKNKTIKLFINIISKSNDNQQTLSDTNNGTKLFFFVKKFFEEIIIALVICIALTKLNILSFIYLLYLFYLTKTSKTMMKFYVLYCFLLMSILVQSLIYLSNLSNKTCPRPNTELLQILTQKLNIPWYVNYLGLQDKYAFFFGFGVNQLQVTLILLEFALVIVIYIYLDFFSYSIYQDVKNKGETKAANEKFNFAAVKLPPRLKDDVKKMSIDLFIQYRDCLRNNFNLDIGEKIQDFFKKLNIKLRGPNNAQNRNDNLPQKDENELVIENEGLKDVFSRKKAFYRMRERNRREGTENIPESDFIKGLQEILYLYLHCFILLLIVIISLMITGMISIFYIVVCFYYLINADKIYLGQVYGYPVSIKKLLKITVTLDIILQTLYQIPYISPDQDSVFQKIFDVLGFIKLIDYEAGNEKKNIELISRGILEVIGKPLIYFFISLQIIIYNSKYFKIYYLTFLLKQKKEFYKNSLIYSFLFNNRRIESFKRSMDLRLESEKAMNKLTVTLKSWNDESSPDNKKKGKKEGEEEYYEKPKERPLDYLRKLREEKDENKEGEEKEDQKEDKKEEEEDEIKTDSKEIKNPSVNIVEMFKAKEEDKKKEIREKHVEPVEVKKKITDILLSGYVTKCFLWFIKNSLNYRTMDDKNKLDYEKNSIVGYNEPKCYLENEIEKQLNVLDLSNFNNIETDYVEDFFLKYKKGKIQKIIKRNKKDIFEKQKNEYLKVMGPQLAPQIAPNGVLNIKDENIIKQIKNIPVIHSIDYKETEIIISDKKFKQFEYLLDTNLFKIYLHDSYQIKSILINLPHFISIYFDYFCYFIMVVEHMINSSFLTMYYPLSIFCYALLENPHPKKIYWQVSIIYTIFVLCVKFFFQLKLFNTIFDGRSYKDFLDTLKNYKVGVTYFEASFGIDFLKYIAFDAVVLIILSINRNILINNGIWDKREEEFENIYAANERVQANKDKIFQNREDIGKLVKYYTSYREEKPKNKVIKNNIQSENNMKEMNIINNIQNEEQKNLIERRDSEIYGRKFKFNKGEFAPEYDEANKTFFEKLFPKNRNEKPGVDLYPLYAISLALIIVYILFFFTKMDQDKTYGPVDLDTTQFSGNMVLFLILHVIILVYDRAIYISQNKDNLKYRYFIYKKNENGEGSLISKEEYIQLKNKIKKSFLNEKDKDKPFVIPPSAFEELNSENYNLFYVQIELFNKPLLHKYILHIFSAFVCHIFIFVYFPMKGNYNLLNTIYCTEEDSCNDFMNNIYTIIFYILYLIYLFLSSFQIRLGYYDIKRKSLFKQNTTITNTIAKIFNAIPFLPNIRNTIDWTFTSTCLDLFQWNKFESIYDTIYDTYCDSEGGDEKGIGEKVGRKDKILMGGLLSFALVFILVVPLILFSSLNPTNKNNNLTSAKLNVDLTFTYENGVELKYNLFENSRAKTISDMFKDEDKSIWEQYNYHKSVQTRNFNYDQIQIVKFSETSDRNWDLADPHIKDLIELLNITNNNGLDKIELNILTEFERPLPAETQTVSHSFTVSIYESSRDSEKSEEVLKIWELKDALENCKEVNLTYSDSYTLPLRITAGEEISEIEDEGLITEKPVQLGFQGCRIETSGEINYLKSYFTFKAKLQDGVEEWEGLEFHIFNDKISETTSGYSVLTFYLTFILVAGSYVQEFLANEPEKIMFTELPHPKPIVDLCEGIQIARYSYDFRKEEELFIILIDLMRSPDFLKKLTQSSIDDFKVREQEEIEKQKEKEEEEKLKKEEEEEKRKKEEEERKKIQGENYIEENNKEEEKKEDINEDEKEYEDEPNNLNDIIKND